MKRFAWLLAAGLIAALAGGCSKAPTGSVLPAGSAVVALGDSLTYGTGAPLASSYPAVLAQLTGWNVVNAGVPGETATQGCARLQELLDQHQPRLVLVLLGGNDFLRRRPESEVVAALESCVAIAQASQTPLALIAVPRVGPAGVANARLYADVASHLEVPLADVGLAKLLTDGSLRADQVHLNEKGYRALAENVAAWLRDNGYLAR